MIALAPRGLVTLSGGDLSYSGNSTNNVRPDVPAGGIVHRERRAMARLGGVISGAGTLRKVDAGTMILTASNTYAGSTLSGSAALWWNLAR